MNYKERRKQDIKTEENVRKHADKIYEKNNLKIKREVREDMQKKGVDFILYSKNRNYYVDEKSASKYANKHLNTFAFEISSKNNKNKMGWFDKDNDFIITDLYSLLYPYSPGNTDNLKTVKEMDVLLISKKEIWKYLEKNGIYNAEQVKQILKERGTYLTAPRKTVFYKYNNDIKFVQSLYIIPEQPINIIINRNVLEKLAIKKMQL